MTGAKLAIAFCVAGLCALLAVCTAARGHNAPSGWAYDQWCCNQSDCRQLADGDVVERNGGWLIQSLGVHIPYTFAEKRASGDEHFHYCEYPKGTPRCFYIPGGDM